MCMIVSGPVLTASRLEMILEGRMFSPPFSHVTTFGRSLSGRPLRLVALGVGRPLVLAVATHHAMEWICGAALVEFAHLYHSAAAENRAPRGTFCLVPLLNPDGVELLSGGWQKENILAPRQQRANGGSLDFSHWQANARGVDLNHNYPLGFDAYRNVEADLGIWEGAPTRYSGVAPLSEPETQALAALIDLLSPDVTLALHTQGEEVFAGGAEGRALILAQLVARRLEYRCERPHGPAAYGGLTDWLIARGMYAVTLECGRGVNPLPYSALPAISYRLSSLLFSLPRLLEYVNFL